MSSLCGTLSQARAEFTRVGFPIPGSMAMQQDPLLGGMRGASEGLRVRRESEDYRDPHTREVAVIGASVVGAFLGLLATGCVSNLDEEFDKAGSYVAAAGALETDKPTYHGTENTPQPSQTAVPDSTAQAPPNAEGGDACPDDDKKSAPGVCGCGEPDRDSDGDGTLDCLDECPLDAQKVQPGSCGCFETDRDSDEDEMADCLDQCPEDPRKTAPGACGCGSVDTDTDEDGVPDCVDGCIGSVVSPSDACGCNEEADDDNDGAANCADECPIDPTKTEPGLCGCGTPDDDTDSDQVPDCLDQCADDDAKTEPGMCGCGVADADTDGDDVPDCFDECPSDPLRTSPGRCGCGTADGDRDGDEVADCEDACPDDPHKWEQMGSCGCGFPDVDTNNNGIIDCFDGNVVMADAFENGPGQWNVIQGQCQISSDSSNYLTCEDQGNEARAVGGNSGWTDVTITADVRIRDFGSDRRVYLAGRFVDADNWYGAALYNASPRKLQIRKKVAGASSDIASADFDFSEDQWYAIRLTLRGDSLQMAIDGVTVLSGTDTSLSSGRIALLTDRSMADWDNISVTTIGY